MTNSSSADSGTLKFSTKLRVRYAETDKMGFCYYGNYASYFEVSRGLVVNKAIVVSKTSVGGIRAFIFGESLV